MTAQPTIHINQRNLDQHTNALTALTVTVAYDNGAEVKATILLRPGIVQNDDKSIRQEFEKLGNALISAAHSANGITS
jgi:hypothetical protein